MATSDPPSAGRAGGCEANVEPADVLGVAAAAAAAAAAAGVVVEAAEGVL
jgi:hypothetical protein